MAVKKIKLPVIKTKNKLDRVVYKYLNDEEYIEREEKKANEKIAKIRKTLKERVENRKYNNKLRLKAIEAYIKAKGLFKDAKIVPFYNKNGTGYTLKEITSRKIITNKSTEEVISALNSNMVKDYFNKLGLGIGEVIKKGLTTLNKNQLSQLFKDDEAKEVLELLGIEQIKNKKIVVSNKDDKRLSGNKDIVVTEDDIK